MNDRLHSMPTPPAASVGTHPEGTRTGEPARAWIGVPPLPSPAMRWGGLNHGR